MLEAISKLVLFPKALSDFARPTLVSGCIKLMKTVQESGRISPFNYEYGYLCFRIMTIAIGICLLQKSSLLNLAVSNMVSEPQVDPVILLSKHVEQVVQIQIHEEDQCLVDDNRQGLRTDLLLGITELPALLDVLYEDRKAFSIALMHTNTLGLAGVILLLGRCLANETRITYNAVETYCEVLWRYSNASAWDKLATQLLTNRYREQAKSTWKPTFVDLEDCVTILRASDIALAPNDHRIPGPFDVSAIPVLMGFASTFIEPGSEPFLPAFLDSAISCLWNALAGGQQPLDRLVDAVRDTFYHISKILASVARTFSFSDPIHKQIIEASFGKDLFELTAALIMMISPRSSIYVSDSRSDNPANFTFFTPLEDSYFFRDAQNLFNKFAKLIPREDLQDTFEHYFPEWLKYTNYFFSCVSALELSQEDHGFFVEAVRCWNAIGVGLGYDGDTILGTLHYCGYARCPHPCITQIPQYTFIAPQLGVSPKSPLNCPAELIRDFQAIVGKDSSLGLFYQNSPPDGKTWVERTEGRENIVELIDNDKLPKHLETGWSPGTDGPVKMVCSIICRQIDTGHIKVHLGGSD
ncbi:putative protein R338 [Acanthamoeba polyphaga mimivirus] [Rhizoctonia solani]|uniref:Uncharacterized protein n=1 Tax=Rhizoctonia solani TaxID=456999 RepID=A0A0K6FPK7_9AGAM|nr:putative protein R338 [Acanthamoeba polyphaga mimivirus] [Rhizoctonia solani]